MREIVHKNITSHSSGPADAGRLIPALAFHVPQEKMGRTMINYSDKYPFGSWFWRDNIDFVLQELAELVLCDFSSWDRDAVDAGIQKTDSEIPLFYEYSFVGKEQLDFAIANDLGTDTVVVLIKCPFGIEEKAKSILNIATKYNVKCRS